MPCRILTASFSPFMCGKGGKPLSLFETASVFSYRTFWIPYVGWNFMRATSQLQLSEVSCLCRHHAARLDHLCLSMIYWCTMHTSRYENQLVIIPWITPVRATYLLFSDAQIWAKLPTCIPGNSPNFLYYMLGNRH